MDAIAEQEARKCKISERKCVQKQQHKQANTSATVETTMVDHHENQENKCLYGRPFTDTICKLKQLI